MMETSSPAIQSFCESHGVFIPGGFQRRPAERWAMIRLDTEPPRLVAATFASRSDAQFYLRRELHHSEFGAGSDLPLVAFDSKNGSLHRITRDCTISDMRLDDLPREEFSAGKDIAANPLVEVVGVHKIAAPEPCHLVEIIVSHTGAPFDPSDITQAWPGKERSHWQVPYDAMILDGDGTRIIGDTMLDRDKKELWASPTRIAFFFHYLDLSQPLESPFGDIHLPPPSPMPQRLGIMKYEPVD